MLCTAAMYHVNGIIILTQTCNYFVQYRACVSAAKLQQFVTLQPIDQMLVPQLEYIFLYWSNNSNFASNKSI